jgi:hypothetical protein
MISNWEKSIKKTKLMANNAFIIKNNCAYKKKIHIFAVLVPAEPLYNA